MATRDENGRFVKGHPGGPGRPKKERSITHYINLLGEQEVEEGVTREQKLAEILWDMALYEKDKQAIFHIQAYTDGKPKERVEVEQREVQPLVISGDDED